MNMKNLINLTFAFCLLLLIACGNDKQQVNAPTKKVSSVLPAPFHDHQKIEVGPDVIFDILTWGRGADSTSSLLILRSDSSKNDFSIASSDNLDGRLNEVFNTDMDTDGYPEIVIYYTENDIYHSAKILCFEFTGTNANKIRFPDLSRKTINQYRGKDHFFVKEGMLFRDIELFDEGDKEGKKVIEKKNIRYFLKGNSFDLEELE
jgi:hypothetical protein